MKMINIDKIKEYEKFYSDFLFKNVIKFWQNSDLVDKEYGGFITSIDRTGKSYNSDKSVWFQGRCLWTFSKLINTYGPNPEWVIAAKLGAEFIRKHCIDKDGRMFFTVTKDGLPLRKRRYFHSECYLVTGFIEYYLFTKEKEDLKLAEEYFDFVYRLFLYPETDPYKVTPKENSKTRKMHSNSYQMELVSIAQALRRITGNKEKYDPIIKVIIDDVFNLFYKEEYQCVLENVNFDGSIINNPTGRVINPGHCIENSWFLMNYANSSNDNDLLKKALNIFNWSLKRGWDEQYGGIFYFVDLFQLPREELEYDMKLWWAHNESLIASILAYKLTGDEKYFEIFEKIHDYSFSHFYDDKYGEWYGYLHRDGSISHTLKGSMWKGPFHLPRSLILVDLILKSIINNEKCPELL